MLRVGKKISQQRAGRPPSHWDGARIMQVARSIGEGGGVSGVAFALEREWISMGFTVQRLTLSDVSPTLQRLTAKTGVIGHGVGVVAFSLFGTLRLARIKRRDTSLAVVVHNDVLGGDIFVNHGLHRALVAGKIASYVLRNPLHGFLIVREYLRHSLHSFTRCVCFSDSEREILIRYYPESAAQVDIIPNGVDLDRFYPRDDHARDACRKSFSASEGDVVFIFVGHEFERKGLWDCLEAFTHLPREYKLWVVGGEAALVDRWRERIPFDLSDRIRFFGRRADVADLLAAADSFLLPSRFEAFSLAGIEAAASGLPLLMGDAGATRAYLRPGENGYFVDGPADIAAACMRVSESLRRGNSMGTRSREIAEDYAWHAVAGMYRDLLVNLREG